MNVNSTRLKPQKSIETASLVNNKLAIIVPTQKSYLNYIEKEVINRISQLYSKRFSLFFILPEGSKINYRIKGFENIYLDPTFFYTNIQGYNSLCMDVNFYKIFENFDFMLIHHLDAIILKDEIELWISKNYSYIGGPSISKTLIGKKPKNLKFFCNGGLSLRKNTDFINVLNSKKIYFNKFDIRSIKALILFKHIKQYINLVYKNYYSKNNFDVQNFTKEFFLNEDFFWTFLAKLFILNFKLPEEILECASFSIDNAHKFYLSKLNDNPFGIHGYTEKNALYLKKIFKI